MQKWSVLYKLKIDEIIISLPYTISNDQVNDSFMINNNKKLPVKTS